MRITGLATGLDMDEIIKSSMKPYRIKIQQQQQNKEIVEIKQKLYRDIISDASKFYDKYFDLTKSDSLLNSSSYKSVVFSSSSSSVTVKGNSEAKVGNYTITGSAATAAKAIVAAKDITDDKIVINSKEFTLTGENEKEKAENLNNELKKAGINVSVRYSDMAGTDAENKEGFIFESTVLGGNSTFTIGGDTGSNLTEKVVKGEDATAAKITGLTLKDIKDNNGKITIGDKEVDLGIINTDSNEDIVKKLNTELNSRNFKAEADETGNITITSTVLGDKVEDPKIKVGSIDLTFQNGKNATESKVTISKAELNGQLIIAGNFANLDMSKAEKGKEDEYLNKIFKENNINVTASLDGENIVLTSNSKGSSSEFNVIKSTGTVATGGNDAEIIIKDDKGGVYTHKGNSNTVTLDGVTFTFNGKIDGEVKVTGKNDVTEVKDKLVKFINDYNTLIEKLNTLTSTKHDKSYVPLTDDQKKEMSETEIKLWNEKVESGQLYKDSNLTRITSSLKSTMRTVMDGSGLNLEKIGIVPVKDYSGTKNGTFTINEEKITKALEDNMDDVMKLFINPAPTKEMLEGKTEEEKVKLKSQTGILYKLKDTLYSEFKTSTSVLYKKVGMEGTSTFSNNELTKSISDYANKIKDMEKGFSRREQALYSKYATLETMMNKLNAQQSNLLSQLGISQ